MLEAAGVPFEVVPAHIDEATIKESLKVEGASAAHIAEVLAEMKAIRISERFPDALVLGADQTLALGKETLDKPDSMEEAARQLSRLSGGRHMLPTAAVMAERGSAVWREIGRPVVTFRPLSDAFIASYLTRMGDAALAAVGACEVEGLGAQLISRIDGDFYSVLGLPLLAVLEFPAHARDSAAMTDSFRLAGVIGWPVSHSLSPQLHRRWLTELGIDGAYVPLPVEPHALPAAIAGLKALGFAGANVTVPHKEAVARWLIGLIRRPARSVRSIHWSSRMERLRAVIPMRSALSSI